MDIKILKGFIGSLCFLLLIPTVSYSAISFDGNGMWETTYNCSEWRQGLALSCDSIDTGGNWTTSNGSVEQITAAANNPAGLGGKGQRHWIGSGDNNNSGGLMLHFPLEEPELWIRWTMRYESGLSWGPLNYDKILYIGTSVQGNDVIPEFANGGTYTTLFAQGSPDGYQAATSAVTFSTVNSSTTGDGLFHTYELHIKMDTNGTDGIGQMWIDNELIIDNHSMNWSNGNTIARQGWIDCLIGTNQRTVNGGDYYVDFDDMVVYNQEPQKVDSSGYPYIGAITDVSTPPELPTNDAPLPPLNLRLISSL